MKRYLVVPVAVALLGGAAFTLYALVLTGNTPIPPPGSEWVDEGSMWCDYDVCIVPSPETTSNFVGAGLRVTRFLFATTLLAMLTVRLLLGRDNAWLVAAIVLGVPFLGWWVASSVDWVGGRHVELAIVAWAALVFAALAVRLIVGRRDALAPG
jgi:hypothetical protein